MNRTCIFIDGENLRNSIDRLFDEYHSSHYLPFGDWHNLLGAVTTLASRKMGRDLELIRAYWYVVSETMYDSFYESTQFNQCSDIEKLRYFKRNAPSIAKEIDEKSKTGTIKSCIGASFKLLRANAKSIDHQFKGWKQKESIIQKTTNRLQFQKFGYLKIRLDNGRGNLKFDGEKGVDIKLATDLITLKDVYDVAIIVSGDGDYIPAVTAVKNLGKQVVMVDFRDSNGSFLPGGSRKLKEHCDFDFSIQHETMKQICRYGLKKNDPPFELDLESNYNF